jgi:hypothetical protein
MTLEQAKSLKHGDILHHSAYKNKDGSCERWRVNGCVQTWKRNPERVRVPIKRGLYEYGAVTEWNCELYHVSDECKIR